MSKIDELTNYIKKLSQDAIQQLLDLVKCILSTSSLEKPCRSYCRSSNIICCGHKCGKQRFFCKHCSRIFVATTHTIVSQSYSGIDVWTEAIRDTVYGDAIDYTAKRLGLNHQTVFTMRHKILIALQQLPETENVLLGEVTELDETFVLDAYKGKNLPTTVERKARKHGAKAVKRGISNEYVCICAGTQSHQEPWLFVMDSKATMFL